MGILLGIFFSSFGIGLSGALMPGPLLSVAVAESYKKGFWAGPVLVVGHAIPELILAVLFTLGLNKVLHNKVVVGVVGIVGGAFLVWLAVKIFLEVRQGITIDLEAKREIGWGPLMAGLWASLSNPGWVIWWATIGARYILLSLEHGILGLAFFYTGHVLADLVWYSLVSFLVSRGRGRISDRIYHGVLYACSLLVLVFAGVFVANGILNLLKA
ncbi:MAG: LysE family translocator [Actinobacteria bacterium]|nr:LysE family translocator [Actinomycetota bacterium]